MGRGLGSPPGRGLPDRRAAHRLIPTPVGGHSAVTLRPSVPSPATAMSALALFVALGGTGYAATRAASAARTTHPKAPTLLTADAVRSIVRKLAPTLTVKAASVATTAGTAT